MRNQVRTSLSIPIPTDVVTFVEATGVDTLAVAIGTSHGIYPKDSKPELKLDLLKEIASMVDIPLVLHGGSANPDNEIAAAVKLGINKINISSDIKDAFYQKCREVLKNPTIREPNSIYPPCIDAMKKVCHFKIDLFNATGKAALVLGSACRDTNASVPAQAGIAKILCRTARFMERYSNNHVHGKASLHACNR